MSKQIIIAERLRIAAVLTDRKVNEFIVAQGLYQIGDIYLGTVENVHLGLDAAFVNIGENEKNGFLPVADLGPLRQKKGSAEITALLKPAQKVTVQVNKEPTGNKGPTLTGNIELTGRYLVLQPHGQGVNISRKINAESERNRLRALGVLVKPPGSGLIIRTEAQNVSEELLIDDLDNLLKDWEAIQTASEKYSPPVLLSRDEDFIHRVLRDHLDPQISKIVVENPDAIDRVRSFLVQHDNEVSVEAHKESNSLLESYEINYQIQDALRPRVNLPSGGYIIIEPTEALTVIDVNSGSLKSANQRETVLWTNFEAATEIARQLKLRNIGGIIIVDFIDMDPKRDQLQLLEHFEAALKNDSSRPQIQQLTELGLVELTRKRQGQNIYEIFGKTCLNCGGLGHNAILPEEELIQPHAKATGLVRSNTSSKNELNNLLDGGLSKKKKSNKLKSDELTNSNQTASEESNLNIISNTNEITGEESALESSFNRSEPEIIGVNMNDDEEKVFSLFGLNPALLLESMPNNDNYLVRVIRPGQDEASILEEARKEITINGPRKKRKGRSASRSTSKANIDISPNEIEERDEVKAEVESQPGEINISNDNELVEDSNSLKEEGMETSKKDSESEIAVSANTEEAEDPRRRRRRSSAGS